MFQELTEVPVFFRPEMVVLEASRMSPSAGKPEQVVADWLGMHLPIDVRSFDPVGVEVLALAHDETYVRAVLAGARANGFGNRLPQVAKSLPFTTGAMLAAAREALANGQVACAPVSGFHHAYFAEGGGFCTFNGLMVAALQLKQQGLLSRVAILDLDQHWGDGTHDIIRHLKLDWVSHYSPAQREPHGPSNAAGFLQRLPGIVSGFHDCDLLLYQAGADAHIDDPLGGWMTSAELAERDQIVFDISARIGLPVAWNLAGGYQRDASGGIEPVLEIHRATMTACAKVFARGG